MNHWLVYIDHPTGGIYTKKVLAPNQCAAKVAVEQWLYRLMDSSSVVRKVELYDDL